MTLICIRGVFEWVGKQAWIKKNKKVNLTLEVVGDNKLLFPWQRQSGGGRRRKEGGWWALSAKTEVTYWGRILPLNERAPSACSDTTHWLLCILILRCSVSRVACTGCISVQINPPAQTYCDILLCFTSFACNSFTPPLLWFQLIHPPVLVRFPACVIACYGPISFTCPSLASPQHAVSPLCLCKVCHMFQSLS